MAKRRSRFACARFGCFGGQARVDKMAEDGYPVKLHIYDLSQGMARQLSSTILGKAIEGIWHTGVVVYGREYYFGGGIQKGEPGLTPYGTPVRVADLGVTHVPREVFEDFLREIGPRYTPATYDLLSHNCNNFSNEAAQFLAGVAVPSYILELPKEVMNSPLGALILPMIQGLETSLRAGAVPQPPQLRPAPAPAPTATAAQPQPQPSAIDVETRSTAADEPEAGKTEVDVNGNGSTVVPPAVQPAAPPAAAAQVSAATKAAPDAEATETADDKPEAGKTAGNDSTVAPTAVQPAAPPAAAAKVSAAPAAAATKAAPDAEGRATAGDKPEAGKTASNDSTVDPPAVQPAAPPEAAAEASAAPAVAAAKAAHPDPLAEAKRRVQEEITREFAAIMASGAARAGEAAALATRRVMERHGLQRAAVAAQRA